MERVTSKGEEFALRRLRCALSQSLYIPWTKPSRKNMLQEKVRQRKKKGNVETKNKKTKDLKKIMNNRVKIMIFDNNIKHRLQY